MASIGIPGVEDATVRDCPELDDDFFDSIGQTYDVVDAWSDKEEEENNSNPVPLPKIKKEPKDSSEVRSSSKTSSRARTESERSDNSRNRDPRARDRNSEKRSKSPDRRRSPIRKNARLSPPGGGRRRLRSPLRHQRRNSPPQWRKNGPPPGNRPSFLEEITQKFPEIANTNLNAPQQFNAGYGGFGMMMPAQPMIGSNFMPGANFMPQQFPQMGVDPYGQPYPIADYNNTMMMPLVAGGSMMPPGTVDLTVVPTPVPAPARVNDSKVGLNQNPEPPKISAATKDLNLQQAKKKAFDEGKISLTDFLKQCSQSKKQDATAAGISSKKSKVHERCKNAAKLLEELTKNKDRLPFVLKPPATKVPSMRSDPVLSWKSPLTMSDTSALFMSQARMTTCRDAIQANPLRNINGKLFQWSRNLGFDLVDLSKKVQHKVDVEREKESKLAIVAKISDAALNPALKKNQRSTQTDTLSCEKCEFRDSLKVEEKLIQTDLVSEPEREDEPGSFIAKLDARTIQEMTRNQEQALVEFCRAFMIRDDRFGVKPSQWDSDDDQQGLPLREPEDRMSYTNPENPHVEAENDFVSFSPLRMPSPRDFDRRNSHSRSPKRRRIADRLGEKIQSPYSSRRFDSDDDLMNLQSSSRFYRQPSPPPNISSYRIPTPPARGDRFAQRRSPVQSNGFRNRSRSNSAHRYRRSRSTSPAMRRHNEQIATDRTNRRGRY